MKMSYPVRVAICGLGNRGKDTYAAISEMMGGRMEIAAIADPIEEKREYVRKRYGVPEAMCFETGEEMFERERLADVALICTQDQLHVRHAVAALERGYHLLLEKPIAVSMEDVRLIEETAKKHNRSVVVCHVLRYAPFFEQIKKIIDSREIGDVMCIQALENVGYWHQAHSFVRGNWRKESESTFMLLAKCCHDLDYLVWLTGQRCARVSSFGSLRHFRPECAPEGAAERCVAGCKAKENCPYDAEKIYLTNKNTGILHGNADWPCCILAQEPTEEKIRKAIEEGPYGRCVYHCDNDVVDHQIVNLELEDGVTVSFTMSAFTNKCKRQILIMGTHGEISADMGENIIRVTPFVGEETVIDVESLAEDFTGHGGGDARLMREFLDLLSGESEGSASLSSISRSVESHLVALAAEESMLANGMPVELG